MASNVSALRTKSRFHPNAELSYTLPGHYYHDPDIHAREKEEIWFKTWQFVGYRHDLTEPGDYITATIIDQPVFVVRSKEGDLRAYYNVCMHRGHILLEGKGNTRMITCPFHAWTYDLDGNLKVAGNSENVAGFDHDDFCLPEIRVEQLAHMVFVNFDADAPTLDSMAGGIAQEFKDAIPRFDDLKFVRRDPYEIKANWKFIFDQMECYHCPVIHPQIMGKDTYLTPSFEITEHEFWSTTITRGNQKVIREMRDSLPFDFGPDDDITDGHIWFIWPNLLFVAHRGNSNIKVIHIMATGVESCVQNVDNFCLNDPPTEKDLGSMNYWRNVLAPQDITSMEKQQLGVHARGYTQGRLMVDSERSWQSEHGTHHFDKLIWLSLHGPRY
jgi:phenylpropionate dioxygenase-like ring-hydroxylating dioxygenase large terminal subunit